MMWVIVFDEVEAFISSRKMCNSGVIKSTKSSVRYMPSTHQHSLLGRWLLAMKWFLWLGLAAAHAAALPKAAV